MVWLINEGTQESAYSAQSSCSSGTPIERAYASTFAPFAAVAPAVPEDAAREHHSDVGIRMEVGVPAAARLECVGQRLSEPISVCIGRLEP